MIRQNQQDQSSPDTTSKKRVLSNIAWLFTDRFLRMGGGLFVGVWVARYLGAEQFGLLNYTVAFVALFGTIATLGLPSLTIRNLTNQPEKREEILGTAFRMQIMSSVLALLLSAALISLIRPNNTTALTLVLILSSVLFFQTFEVIDSWFQSQFQSKYTVIAKNIAFVVTASLKVLLLNLKAPVEAFAISTLIETTIYACILVLLYSKNYKSILKWRWNPTLARSFLRESYPLILSGITIIIYMKIDQIMLGEMIGDKAVGLYASATRISEIWYFIPTTISSSIAPLIYKAKSAGNERLYYQLIENLLRTLSAIALIIAIPIGFISKQLILSLFGNEYADSAQILNIHIWSSIFVFIGVGSSSWFIAENLLHLTLRRTLMGAVMNIILNYFLIPIYGGVGAAIATVISQAIASWLSNIFNPCSRKLFFIQLRSFLPFPISFNSIKM